MEFTKTLNDVLVELHYGQPNQDARLTKILALFTHFPSFSTAPAFPEKNIDMLTMFMEKYDIREISQSTTDLFLHYWLEKTNELLVKYQPKILMWKNNFKDLFKFTVKLEKDETENTSRNNQNTYYLNPVSSNPTNLKPQDVDTSTQGVAKAFHSERDVLQTIWGKTRADILQKIMDLKDIYNDCLSEFETIFMGVI